MAGCVTVYYNCVQDQQLARSCLKLLLIVSPPQKKRRKTRAVGSFDVRFFRVPSNSHPGTQTQKKAQDLSFTALTCKTKSSLHLF